MIDPSLDVWVWVACLVLLALLGARAWVVETGQGRLGRTPVQVRVLSAGVVLAVVGLFGMLAMQGGVLLVDSIVTGTDPSEAYYGPTGHGRRPERMRPHPDPAAPPGRHPGRPAAPAGQLARPGQAPAAGYRATPRRRTCGGGADRYTAVWPTGRLRCTHLDEARYGRSPVRTLQPPKPIATYFVSRNSSMPTLPPSRPSPDCLIPPNGAAGLDTRPVLSPTMPDSSRSDTRSARVRFSVKR